MEKFEFEKKRTTLAEDLKNTRKEEGGREKAKEKLAEAKNSEDYQDSKTLHRIRNEFPRVAVDEAMDFPERIDDPAKWDVEDVSDKIPEEYKYRIDKATLYDISSKVYPTRVNNKERWDVNERIGKIRESKPKSDDRDEIEREEKLFDKEIEGFRDELSGHRLLDRRNLNHTVMGHGGTADHYRAKSFDRYSKIEASSAEYYENGLWTNIAGGYYNMLGNPTVIFSPNNPATRNFFETKFDPPIGKLLEKLEEKERESPGSALKELQKLAVFDWETHEFKGFNVASYRGDSDLARVLFLAGLPISEQLDRGCIFFPLESEKDARERQKKGDGSKIKIEENWMDIADCVIDLRQRKVWKRKYSKEESEKVDADKEKYKKWIEENLIHSSLEDLMKYKK
ncbi:MAG: hypothetical protein Q7R75_00975 [bacterium]|nr:hypothetical protein [bacterium]